MALIAAMQLKNNVTPHTISVCFAANNNSPEGDPLTKNVTLLWTFIAGPQRQKCCQKRRVLMIPALHDVRHSRDLLQLQRYALRS